MSRSLLILALVALLFAGVVSAQSSSSTGDESSTGDVSSTGDFSSTSDVSSTGVSSTGVSSTGVSSTGVSSTGVSSTGVSSTGASSTGASSTGASSTGASSTGVSSTGVSSTGSNATVVSSSTGSVVPPTAQNVTLAIALTAAEQFNSTVQAALEPEIAKTLGITYTSTEWTSTNVGRRLLAVVNTVTFQGVPEDKKNNAVTILTNSPTTLTNALNAAVPGLAITGAADVTPSGGAASALAASPLLLAAAAVLAMLF